MTYRPHIERAAEDSILSPTLLSHRTLPSLSLMHINTWPWEPMKTSPSRVPCENTTRGEASIHLCKQVCHWQEIVNLNSSPESLTVPISWRTTQVPGDLTSLSGPGDWWRIFSLSVDASFSQEDWTLVSLPVVCRVENLQNEQTVHWFPLRTEQKQFVFTSDKLNKSCSLKYLLALRFESLMIVLAALLSLKKVSSAREKNFLLAGGIGVWSEKTVSEFKSNITSLFCPNVRLSEEIKLFSCNQAFRFLFYFL